MDAKQSRTQATVILLFPGDVRNLANVLRPMNTFDILFFFSLRSLFVRFDSCFIVNFDAGLA